MSTFQLQKYTTEIFKEHETVTKKLTQTVSPLNSHFYRSGVSSINYKDLGVYQDIKNTGEFARTTECHEEQMEAWGDTESILEFTQGHCFSHGTMPLCSAVRRFYCSVRRFYCSVRILLIHSYCTDWTTLIEAFGLTSISLE